MLCQALILWYCVFVLLDDFIIIRQVEFVTLHLLLPSLLLIKSLLPSDSTTPLAVECHEKSLYAE